LFLDHTSEGEPSFRLDLFSCWSPSVAKGFQDAQPIKVNGLRSLGFSVLLPSGCLCLFYFRKTPFLLAILTFSVSFPKPVVFVFLCLYTVLVSFFFLATPTAAAFIFSAVGIHLFSLWDSTARFGARTNFQVCSHRRNPLNPCAVGCQTLAQRGFGSHSCRPRRRFP